MEGSDEDTTAYRSGSGEQTTWVQTPTGEIEIPPPVGVLAGRYEMLDCVGRGGTAWVYKVRDQQSGEMYAAKILRTDLSLCQVLLDRMAAEACAMMILDHPHIARVVDMGNDERTGSNFVVLEWLGGGSLAELVDREGPQGPERAIDLVLQVLDGLEAAHARGIVHRDVKPANVLLDDQGRAKVVDFGIARIPDAGGETGVETVMGTMSTMAPEQRVSAASVTPAADVYSAGALLYFLVTGQSPVDLFAVPVEHPRWRALPAALVPVVRRAMTYAPDARYQSARELADALARVDFGTAPPPPPRTREGRG